MKRKPYKIIIFTDDGDVESGPIIHDYDMLIYAKDEKDAKEIVEKYYDGYDGISIELADKDYIEENIRLCEDERDIAELEWYLENYDKIISGYRPEDKEEALRQIEVEKDFHSWTDVYKMFMSLAEEDVEDFYYTHRGNIYFDRAWIEWNKK